MRSHLKLGLYLLTLLCIVPTITTNAQEISFSDVTSILTQRQKGSPISKGFADVNGDFRDDLLRAANGKELMVDIQSNNGEFFQNMVIDTITGDTWALLVSDIDNDGKQDIMSTGSYNGFKIYGQGDEFGQYNIRQTSETDFFAQGANYVDINNDGWLDAFICDDDAESEVYINDGTGLLVRNSDLIDMRTTPVSDNSGNYASEWGDIDGDGDLDLYIAKCRLGVEENTDPRRINMLFINELNEGGTFREASAEWGVKIGEQTWTCNFGDIDNDGDLDLFLANHEFRCQMFENINGERFEEIPLFSGGEELFLFAYQTSLADFNNDGFLDILLVGDGEQLLYNNGDKTFTSTVSPFGFPGPFSFALGDLNEDGYLDAFSSYRSLGTGETGDRDILWQNSGSTNNYFALSLVGEDSNKSGIGAKVTIEGSWGQQLRTIQAGVGYGITNSLTARFGLGEATAIDRMTIVWPSGAVNTYEGADLIINEHYVATENQCVVRLAKTEATDTRLDCTISGTFLSVDQEFDEIVWSPTGETTNEIEVVTPGAYNATLTTDGCDNVSQTVIVRGPEELIVPRVNVENNIVLCANDAVVLEVLNDTQFDWSTNETTETIQITESGTFFASNSSDCETVESTPIEITFIDGTEPVVPLIQTISAPQTVVLQGPNETTTWYSDPEGLNVIGQGATFETGEINSDTTLYFDHDYDLSPPAYLGGPSVNETTVDTDFSFENVNGGMLFAVNEPCLFRSVSVNAKVEGPRHIQISEFVSEELVVETTVDIPEGISEVLLNFSLEPGSYRIKVNGESSTATFGSANPELAIVVGEFNYPFLVSNLANITRSEFGRGFYQYFFDFKMEPIVESCRSGITPFDLIFDVSSTDEVLDFELNIFPNPVADYLNINSEKKINTLNLIDNTGRTVWSRDYKSQNIELNLTDFEAGLYFLELQGDDFNTVKEVVKVK